MSQDSRTKAEFGKAMRKYRHAAGLTQEALADKAGINRTYAGDVERGERNISLLNMVRVASALEIRLSQIILEMERHGR